MKSFRELDSRAKLSASMLYLKMNFRVIFGSKVLLFISGALVYFAAFCVIRSRLDKPLSLTEALAWLVWLPVTVTTVFFSMELVSHERETGVIETLFMISVSRYRIWILKFVVLISFLVLETVVLVVMTDMLAIDLFIMLTVLYTIPPVVFFAALTILFSVMFRSGNAAGLCIAAILMFMLLLVQTSDGRIADVVIFPYLNPFDRPLNRATFDWARTVLFNKIGFLVLGCIWFWRALRRLERRERLLE